MAWFANEIRDIHENEQRWSRMLRVALLAAIGVAAIHAFHLYEESHVVSEMPAETNYLNLAIATIAIVLPPLGTACLSIRAMYNFRGRSRVYENERSLLHAQRGALGALIQEAKQTSSASDSRDLDKIDFNFRAIALRTEQSLSVELQQWMLLMERPEHEVSP